MPTEMSAAKSLQKHLKLYTEQHPSEVRSSVDAVSCLPDLLYSFQTVTGWSLQYVTGAASKLNEGDTVAIAVNSGRDAPAGHVRLQPVAEAKPGDERESGRVKRNAARALAASMADMLGELLQTRYALWQREAELAAGIPLVPHREEEKHLAARLEAVLKGGAEAVGCVAAALYLLDEGTTELKLRSCWGLPFDRLTASARPLQGAMADLEAMLGHAVVLNDVQTIRMWNMPEDFPTAVCVPVSTPTTLLGTLWVFNSERREFNDRQTNILEVVAGRLASDLEREMLMRSGCDGAEFKKQLASVERVQRNGLPTIAPMLDGWDVAGWTYQAQGAGGAFHDWFCLPDGLLAVAVGRTKGDGVAAAITANAVKTSLRAHSQYHRQAEPVLQQLNLTLWTSSAGDQHANLFYGLIETATGRVCGAAAGRLSALLLRPTGWEPISHASQPLGESPEASYRQYDCELQPGEALVLFSDGGNDALEPQGRLLGDADLAESLLDKLSLKAEALTAAVRSALEACGPDAQRRDRSIVVVKRTT
jgi:serine phosphatase RsbU (regulator of sigma subunit)